MDVPWRDEDLLNYVREAIQNGPKNKRRCTKLSGAATTDALRLGLRTHGIRTSERDVYVKGMSTEIDLIVPRMACDTCGRTVYDAAEVLVAFEVKKRGISDKGGLTKIRCDFSAYSAACGGAKCMYVTLTETPWTGRATFERVISKCCGRPRQVKRRFVLRRRTRCRRSGPLVFRSRSVFSSATRPCV
jgi:hypothetical protein